MIEVLLQYIGLLTVFVVVVVGMINLSMKTQGSAAEPSPLDQSQDRKAEGKKAMAEIWRLEVARVDTMVTGVAIVLFFLGLILAYIGGSLGDYAPEFIGIAFTVIVIDQLYRRRQNQIERRRVIQQYYDEIMDYLDLEEVEATRLITQRIHRLNLKGVSRMPLVQAYLREAYLSGVDLSESPLIKANLQNANLKGANLKNTDLRDANLTGADLSGTDLSGANLCEAILLNADLSGATLVDADFNLCWYNSETQWPKGFNLLKFRATRLPTASELHTE